MDFLDTLYERISTAFPTAGDDTGQIHAYLLDHYQELYSALNEFRTHYEAWHFIRHDRDLKLKAADIWKAQKEVFESTMAGAWETLKEVAEEAGCNLEDLDLEGISSPRGSNPY